MQRALWHVVLQPTSVACGMCVIECCQCVAAHMQIYLRTPRAPGDHLLLRGNCSDNSFESAR